VLFAILLIVWFNLDAYKVKGEFMTEISANELKVKGISSIEAGLSNSNEAVISVRGKGRFVVMNIEHYHYLRECELEAALAQVHEDVAAGRYVTESPEAHVVRLEKM